MAASYPKRYLSDWRERNTYHAFVAQSRSIPFPKSSCSSLDICWLTTVLLKDSSPLLNGTVCCIAFHCWSVQLYNLHFGFSWLEWYFLWSSLLGFTLAPDNNLDPLRSHNTHISALALAVLSVAFYIDTLYSIILHLTSQPGSELFWVIHVTCSHMSQ